MDEWAAEFLVDLADEIVTAYDAYLQALDARENIQGTSAKVRIAVDRYRDERKRWEK